MCNYYISKCVESVVLCFLFISPLLGFSEAIRISTRFVHSELDSELIANSYPKVRAIFSGESIIELKSESLGNQSHYPWPKLRQLNSLDSIRYCILSEDPPEFQSVFLGTQSSSQFLDILSPFIIDYHLRTMNCYANGILACWDTLYAFPLVKISTYKEYYGDEILTWKRMKILEKKYSYECTRLNRCHEIFKGNRGFSLSDLRELEESHRLVDLLESND